MSPYRKPREGEWMLSLERRAASPFFWAMVLAVGGVAYAAYTVLYDSAAWINQFGRSGWILAIAAAIIICGMIIIAVTWAWDGIRTVRYGRRDTDSAEAEAMIDAREHKQDEAIRNVERSVFLLLVSATDDATYRALWAALDTLPADNGGNTDAELSRTILGLSEHRKATEAALRRTQWAHDLAIALGDTESAVALELRSAVFPEDINPEIYRSYLIASRKRTALKEFLENAIATADAEREHTLGMLRDQRTLNTRS